MEKAEVHGVVVCERAVGPAVFALYDGGLRVFGIELECPNTAAEAFADAGIGNERL